MNHIADANKMVSDTPRTDSLLTAILDSDGFVHNGNCPQRWVNYARELERELNAANDRIQSLIEERDRANRLADWKWNLRDEFQLLLGTDKIEEGIEAVKELKRRIKRLEEDSDRLHWLLKMGLAWRGCYNGHWLEGEWLYSSQYAIETIDKAKEAKL